MKCQNITNYILNTRNYYKVCFKGRNDVDPSKTKYGNKDHNKYGTNGFIGYSYSYNSYGQPLWEQELGVNCAFAPMPFAREYSYYENGNLKSKKDYYNGSDPYKDGYNYIEYNIDGSVYKRLSNNLEYVDEYIYNDGDIAEKNVIKPGYIDDIKYNTVELLYNKNKKGAYRILGKDYFGNLLKDITSPKQLAKITKAGNKILLK